MKRVIVMGGPGAGKSTVARELAIALDLSLIHLDRYFWRPGWVQSPWAEFAENVRALAERERWVIDGNYSLTLPDRLARADTLVFLDLPLHVRLPRVLKRRFQYRGQSREDMGVDCPERIDWVFLKQVLQYRRARRPKMLALIQELEETDMNVFHLRSTGEVEAFLLHARADVTLLYGG